MGGCGFAVRGEAEIGPALDAAFATKGPVIIEASVDQYVPMLPPKVPEDYRRNFRKALPETPGHDAIEANLGARTLADHVRGLSP